MVSGTRKTRRKDRIKVSLQRVQPRVPLAEGNESRTDQELAEQRRCPHGRGTPAGNRIRRKTDSNPALNTKKQLNFSTTAYRSFLICCTIITIIESVYFRFLQCCCYEEVIYLVFLQNSC